ncbi:chalcone isomerase family protein [Cupriavidus taiwanensis]|uniref:chalcone isomerase family protein n=1 Tax=Cupriavidus taiwanensis TaxID=164546 RepID=UPI00253FA416|nr:chalcone isomerase family protein [Cupriavidus taiwanensis]MDK3026480.1 chalcone isomerase family protein [Cupriavidus taiwanensis]
MPSCTPAAMLSRIRCARLRVDTLLRSRLSPGRGHRPGRRLRLAAVLVALAAAAAVHAVPGPARALEIEGMRFDDAARVGGKELQLNGAALRTGFLTKGYVAALYLEEKARNATVVLGTPGAKRLQLRILRETEPPAVVRAIRQGMRDNHTEAQMRALAARLVQFERTLGELGTAHKGDVINLDFSPQTGTVIAINGTPRGRPIPGEDFYQALLRVFLGERPADAGVKRGLLGG